MTALIEKLNRDGCAVYTPGHPKPSVACWVGVQDGRIWVHKGDAPHWGPKLTDLYEYGGYALREKGEGERWQITALNEAFELQLGASMDAVQKYRETMTREEAIAMLGDPPQG